MPKKIPGGPRCGFKIDEDFGGGVCGVPLLPGDKGWCKDHRQAATRQWLHDHPEASTKRVARANWREAQGDYLHDIWFGTLHACNWTCPVCDEPFGEARLVFRYEEANTVAVALGLVCRGCVPMVGRYATRPVEALKRFEKWELRDPRKARRYWRAWEFLHRPPISGQRPVSPLLDPPTDD